MLMEDFKFVSPATYKYGKGLVLDGTIVTEEGQTKSLAELVKNAQLGIPLFQDRLAQMQYDDDDPDFEKDNDWNDPTLDPSLDTLDAINIQRELQERIDKASKSRQKYLDDKKKREMDEFRAYQEAKRKELAAKRSTQPDSDTPPGQGDGKKVL